MDTEKIIMLLLGMMLVVGTMSLYIYLVKLGFAFINQ